MEAVKIKKVSFLLTFCKPLPPPLLADFSLNKYLFGAEVPFRYASAQYNSQPLPPLSQQNFHSERSANFDGFP